ncbi:MAG TPA: D-TA family PLP-dependent enzyme [Isosphaeraceae bacterium]|jgi:D-serine deaminase-like pyridoxal phosphate-dependent protein|nr:D-TA family PLP-dependent enzyme [Isosphaeraceae bacterium]
MMIDLRYPIRDPDAIPSPSLLVFREVVARNLAAMLGMAGGPDRLRPHVKTHKMPALVRMVEANGVGKHKCATLAEAEMVARAGGRDVLIAYPMVGPNVARLASLVDRYPETTFRVAVDDLEAARGLSSAIERTRRGSLPALVDLDVGMGRTGIDPAAAFDLIDRLQTLPGLDFDGLHAYDGHIREQDIEARRRVARSGLDTTFALRDRLEGRGIEVRRVVLGGTPTFPIHATVDEPGVECSPGTCLLHDAGYGGKFPDLPFEPAALLLTRVISRPRPGRLCLDLGHKAVAADPAGPRLTLLGLPGAALGPQSEEHLVVDAPDTSRFPPGTPLLAIPTHVCPTCALHDFASVIDRGEVADRWDVTARGREGTTR